MAGDQGGGPSARRPASRRQSWPTENLVEMQRHEVRWQAELESLIEKKALNHQLIDREKLAAIIEALDTGKQSTDWKVWALAPWYIEATWKAMGAHNWSQAYAVHTQHGGNMVLLRRKDVDRVLQDLPNEGAEQGRALGELPVFVASEDLFQVLRDAHVSTGHGKRDKMYKKIKERYANISRDMCDTFHKSCSVCVKTRCAPKKTMAGSTPILTVGFGSRGQVDLIDYQSSAHGGMKWLLTYCDHGTKFACTRPLRDKKASQSRTVAMALLDIFATIGPPVILQPDNGREFSGIASKNAVTEEDVQEVRICKCVADLWPGCKMVTGSARHSESNGGIERFNRTIEAQ
eukprot:scaffold111087_cov31-Prasinocladus_malaysianus.AAC.1